MAIEKADKLKDILENVRRIFLDTAPVIYFVEKNEQFLNSVKTVFGLIDDGRLVAITSPITLAECLVQPYRRELTQLQKDFFDLKDRTLLFRCISKENGELCTGFSFRLRRSYATTGPTSLFELPTSLFELRRDKTTGQGSPTY